MTASTAPEGVEGGRVAKPQCDGLNEIVEEHDMLRGLFRSYESATSRRDKVQAVHEIVRLTSQHASAEERSLYPWLAQRMGGSEGRALYDRMTTDDQVNKHMLHYLGSHAASAEAGSDEEWRVFDSTARKFFMVEEEHLAREEEEVIERLRYLLPRQAERDGFTAAWRSARAWAPTKPHPEGPSRTPYTYLAHPIVAGLDAAVDAGGALLRRLVHAEQCKRCMTG